MIEDCDGYKYFTFLKNYNQLIEYANKLNAEISLVTITSEMPPLLDLVDLSKALTNQDYKVNVAYSVIETKIKKRTHIKNEKTQKAETIRNYILEQFLCQKPVSANNVAYHFKTYNFLIATYKNHILEVRKELLKKGYNIMKTSPGHYSIINGKPKKRSYKKPLRKKSDAIDDADCTLDMSESNPYILTESSF